MAISSKQKKVIAENKKGKIRLGAYFRRKRVEAGLTQAGVGIALGYASAHQYVSNWERGLCSPPISQLGAICKLYKINDVKELIDLHLESYRNELESALGPMKNTKSSNAIDMSFTKRAA